jgi:hypothetical protein
MLTIAGSLKEDLEIYRKRNPVEIYFEHKCKCPTSISLTKCCTKYKRGQIVLDYFSSNVFSARVIVNKSKQLRDFSPLANYTDRVVRHM